MLIQAVIVRKSTEKRTSYDGKLHLNVVSRPLSKGRILILVCLSLAYVFACAWHEKRSNRKDQLDFGQMPTMMLQYYTGDPLAQNELGIRFLEGTGVPKDLARAEDLFRTAAQRGVANAWINLALVLQEDPKRVEEMNEAIRQGALAGSPLAELSYACFLAEKAGRWTPEAIKWLQQAHQHGVPEAHEILKSLQQ